MIAQAPTVVLQMESRPQTLTVVRGMLSGVAEQLEMDAELLDDLKTSVSEACNNVVCHAYKGEPGPMDVRLFVDERDESLRVTVEDQGVGLREPAPPAGDGSGGLGVSVMQALTRELRLIAREGGGTEVLMRFDGSRDSRPLFHPPAAAGAYHPPAPPRSGEVAVTVSPVALTGAVLGRVARTIAAGAHFSLDRFSDVYLVTDALAAHAAHAAVEDRMSARLTASDRRVQIAAGPFAPGSTERLRDRTQSPLALIANRIEIHPCGDYEYAEITVVDDR